jgi:hypothetical protein
VSSTLLPVRNSVAVAARCLLGVCCDVVHFLALVKPQFGFYPITHQSPPAPQLPYLKSDTMAATIVAAVAAGKSAAQDTLAYFAAFAFFFVRGGALRDCKVFDGQADAKAKTLHVYSLARTIATFNEPHYRAPTFGTDVRANLRNLAIPATGVPLSTFFLWRWSALLFVLVLSPLACAVAAAYVVYSAPPAEGLLVRWAAAYGQLLLNPQHWFAIWRLNCALVAEHSRLTRSAAYRLEDKGAFLLEGDKAGLPVSPFMKTAALVVKHRAIEGGMGIHMFSNFCNSDGGGEWIIQPRMRNSEFIASLLPADAPLSTLRVITASSYWLRQQRQLAAAAATAGGHSEAGASSGSVSGAAAMPTPAPAAGSTAVGAVSNAPVEEDYRAFTVVFRAGLAGASTDHKSICFDVDAATGEIRRGISNLHWYAMGPGAVGRLGATAHQSWTHHPDTHAPITGRVIPDFAGMLRLVLESHRQLVPDVPLVGWDVALTPEGVALLEINISCNFFNGGYDRAAYVDYMHDFFGALEARGAQNAAAAAASLAASALPAATAVRDDEVPGLLASMRQLPSFAPCSAPRAGDAVTRAAKQARVVESGSAAASEEVAAAPSAESSSELVEPASHSPSQSQPQRGGSSQQSLSDASSVSASEGGTAQTCGSGFDSDGHSHKAQWSGADASPAAGKQTHEGAAAVPTSTATPTTAADAGASGSSAEDSTGGPLSF